MASTMAQPSSVQGQALRPSRPYNLPQQQQQSQGPVSVQQVVENLNREVAATCTSVEMTVPDGAVRFCIGKQGASISMIQKQSRAHFDFAKVTTLGLLALKCWGEEGPNDATILLTMLDRSVPQTVKSGW